VLVLSEAFPPPAVMSVVEDEPGLLLLDDLEERLEECSLAIPRLFPRLAPSPESVAQVLAEEPMLIRELPDLRKNWVTTDISELPIEVQNALSYAVRDPRAL